jgi:1,4-dihydroxy-2-naphthoyl-CoA hydrolase
MSLLEKIQSMKMPFAELKGVTFVEADRDRVVAKMLVRPDLCTARNTIHGGAVMAFADSVGAAATVINLPEDANGTTTIESKTNFIGGAKEGSTVIATATPVHRGGGPKSGRRGWRPRTASWLQLSPRPRWCSDTVRAGVLLVAN